MKGKLVIGSTEHGDQEHAWDSPESLEKVRALFAEHLPTHTAWHMHEPGKGTGPVTEIVGDEPEIFMHPRMAGG